VVELEMEKDPLEIKSIRQEMDEYIVFVGRSANV
jgi:hypothetical protein